MTTFPTRYRAEKEKKNNPWYSSTDKVIKVDGGYTIMTIQEYYIWKEQK